MCSETIVPLATVRCKAIGVVKMIDGGSRDYKIIAVPLNDPFYNCYNDVSDLPIHLLEEIKHFFMVYKTLEGKVTNIKDVMGKDEARDVMNNCIKAKNEGKKWFDIFSHLLFLYKSNLFLKSNNNRPNNKIEYLKPL